MGAGAFSAKEAVKAAEGLVAIKVDCTEEGQNEKLQRQYNVQGYPTVLFVTNDEEVIEDLYPRNGGEFAAQIEAFIKNYKGKKSWIRAWAKVMQPAKKEDMPTKPVVIIIPSRSMYKMSDLEAELKKALGKDFDKFVYAHAKPKSESLKDLEAKLPKADRRRRKTMVVLDPRLKNPYEKPLSDPGRIDADERASILKNILKDWK